MPTTPVTVELVEDSKLIELFPTLDAAARSSLNASITRMIEEYCNTKFDTRTYEDEYCDDRSSVLFFNMPIISVESVYRIDDTELLLLDADEDYYVYPDRLDLVSATGNKRGLVVSYTAGLPVVPPIAYEVALDLARYKAFKESEGILLFYKSQTFEERQYKTNPSLDEFKILGRMKQYVQLGKKTSAGKGSIRVGVM